MINTPLNFKFLLYFLLDNCIRYLFTSSKRTGKMECCVVMHDLSATVAKCMVLCGNKDNRVSCSWMRAAIATEMAG